MTNATNSSGPVRVNRSWRVGWHSYGSAALHVTGALVGVGLAYVIGTAAEPESDTIEFEFYKLLIQALLIVAAGAFLSTAIQEVRRRREAEERLREFSRNQIVSILRDVEEDYRLIKRTRKMLRLESPIPHSLYRAEMINLEDIKRSMDEVETNIAVLRESSTGVDLAGAYAGVHGMGDYVDEVWDEYEKKGRQADKEFAPDDLPKLRDFVKPSSEGSFFVLWNHHHKARQSLIAELARQAVASKVPVAGGAGTMDGTSEAPSAQVFSTS